MVGRDRRDPVAGLLHTDRAAEWKLLDALAGTAVPSPVVLWPDLDGTWFERPALVMRREPSLNLVWWTMRSTA